MAGFLDWLARRECIRRRVMRSIPVVITCDGYMMMAGTVEELCMVSRLNGLDDCVKFDVGGVRGVRK